MSKNTLWVSVAILTVVIAVALVFLKQPVSGAPGKVFEVDPHNNETRLVALRRLNPTQYKNIIRDVFGGMIDIKGRFVGVARREHGLLEVGASEVGLSPVGIEVAEEIAREVASQVVGERYRQELISCQPHSQSEFDDNCARQFITSSGRLLYRRPLTTEEQQRLLDLAARTTAQHRDFYAGLERSLVNILVSPNFLFRTETAVPNREGEFHLDSYSRASRLSFLLWDSAPDAPLLQAAENGELYHTQGLQKQLHRMLASPKFERGVRAFFTDMLAFDGFDTLLKDASRFPGFTWQVMRDAREQTLRTIVDHLIVREADYRDLFISRNTFLTPMLAAQLAIPLYQNKPNAAPDYWQAYEFADDDPRAGLLAQLSFVALHSHPGRTSPTLRGKALREHLLCQEVPPPPPNVNFQLVQDESNPAHKTVRERLSAHATNPTCAGCHKITDPIGLALENFDSGGRYRTMENGQKIDASGELDGVAFTDALGLGLTVRNNPTLVSCLVNRVYAYGTGRGAAPQQRRWLKTVRQDFVQSGHTLPALLRRIGASEEFYRTTLSVALASSAQHSRSLVGAQ